MTDQRGAIAKPVQHGLQVLKACELTGVPESIMRRANSSRWRIIESASTAAQSDSRVVLFMVSLMSGSLKRFVYRREIVGHWPPGPFADKGHGGKTHHTCGDNVIRRLERIAVARMSHAAINDAKPPKIATAKP